MASFRLYTFKQERKFGESEHYMLGLCIHNVVYTKSDGGTVDGTYIPVLFDDSRNPTGTDPEDSIPIVYTNIGVSRPDDCVLVEMSWSGTTWCKMEWNGLVDGTNNRGEKQEVESFLLHEYVTCKDLQNQTSNPDAGRATYLESNNGSEVTSIGHRRKRTGKSSFHFDAYDWKRLPTLHHIVSWLQELPVFEVEEASTVDEIRAPDFSKRRRVE